MAALHDSPVASPTRQPLVEWVVDGPLLRCTVRWPHRRPALSEVLPIFEQLGLELVDHQPWDAADGFVFTDVARGPFDDVLALMTEAFVAAWEGSVDRDELAVLVVEAQLHARQVQLVRAAYQYLRQAGLGASRSYVCSILATHREFVRRWVDAFEERFDPAGRGLAEHDLDKYAEAATTQDEFRVLQWYAGFADAVTRTSYFRRDAGRPTSTLVFKLDPSRLPFPTDPGVAVETFVHHPDVEGLHVRYGPVARGGLRWSDRVEDYRDEVLALAKAQQVKNALIVPAGAKGAFVVKVPLAGLSPAAGADEVRRCYQLFVRGLLDITDDVSVTSAVTHPPQVAVKDGPDPYLVVAADKGTAAFSDLANAESVDAGFWLEDAFASGGSTGFNHKELGVTAKGAWVAVRRHFTELGLDPERDPITAVGIGDMSGDVFGNGMLLSSTLRLVAAFDHRHIFLDPDPDPAVSFAERRRVAALPASSWADYDARLISPGGGVFPRSGRSVRLSPEVRAVLGVDVPELSTDELVRAMLRAPVDLLWNGGIGTYVRATHESDADVADRANDRVRITADQLRCRVVGEGGNLGLTQAARIEYASAGGRVNADFIDNVAGVNTSDREVNLKILLRAAEDAGLLERVERNRLLQACADDVVRAVLGDSERQALAISVAESYGVTVLDRHDQVMRNLEDHGLDRGRERLPDAEEVERRRAAGLGLTRPEIAVILAHAKNLVQQLLLEGEIPDDPGMSGLLERYFPEALRHRYAAQVATHRLGRQIIATQLANQIIDRVGPGFVYRVEDRTGASTDQAIRALLVVQELLGLDDLWDGLAPYPVAPTMPVRQALERALEHNASWLIRRRSTLASVQKELAAFRPAVARLRERVVAGDEPDDTSPLARALAELHELGAPSELLALCRATARMPAALALSDASSRSGFDVLELEQASAHIGDAVGLGWLYATIPITSVDPHWVQLAKSALRDELSALTIALAVDVLGAGGLASWAVENEDALARARAAYAGLAGSHEAGAGAGADVDVAMLTVGVQVLRDLSHAVGV